MSNIQKIVSEKGKFMIVYEGFVYTLERTTETKLIFRCKNRSCKGTVKPINKRLTKLSFCFKGRCHTNLSMDAFLSSPTSHSHAPTPDIVPVIELKTKSRLVLKKQMNSQVPFSTLLYVPFLSMQLVNCHELKP